MFTLDAKTRVSAVSTAGETLWSTELVPPADSASSASGGGLAYGDGRLFVTSAYGTVTALDARDRRAPLAAGYRRADDRAALGP